MSAGSLRLVQVHGAGSPNRGHPKLGLSIRLPDDFAKELKVNRGDFMLASLNGKTVEYHAIDQKALEGLMATVTKEEVPE